MKDIHVLYGFSSEEIAGGIEKSLRSIGYRIVSTMRPTKLMLKEYAEQHREIEVVILKEFLDGGDSYSVNELVELVDNVSSGCRFIVVLSPSYRGKDSMRELYNAGIIEAVFSDGKKGVDPDKIAELAVYGRTRTEARDYYKIQRKVVKKLHLTYMEHKEAVDFLGNERSGINLMERFEHVTRWFTPDQLAQFINTMPAALMDSLRRYREYYPIHNQLYRQGLVDNHLRCPRDAVDGLDSKEYAKGVSKMSVKEPDNNIFITPVVSRVEPKERVSTPEMGMDPMPQMQETSGVAAGVEVGAITPGSMGSNLGHYMEQTRRAAENQIYGDFSSAVEPQPQEFSADPAPAFAEPLAQEPADYTEMDVDSLIGMLG